MFKVCAPLPCLKINNAGKNAGAFFTNSTGPNTCISRKKTQRTVSPGRSMAECAVFFWDLTSPSVGSRFHTVEDETWQIQGMRGLHPCRLLRVCALETRILVDHRRHTKFLTSKKKTIVKPCKGSVCANTCENSLGAESSSQVCPFS